MKNQRTIYFHIGGPKTGSSALQNFLELNREKLSSCGIDYNNAPPIETEFDITSGNGVLLADAINGSFSENYHDEILCSYFEKCNKAICSSEVMSIIDEQGWKKILASCNRLNLNYEIIFFVRDVAPYIYSSYNQAVKRHGEYRSANFIKEYEWTHVNVLRTLTRVISREKIKVIHYEKIKTDIVGAFFEAIRVDHGFLLKLPRPKSVNRSLDEDELGALRPLNKILGENYSSEMSDFLINANPELKVKARYDPNVIHLIRNKFLADVVWVNNTFFEKENVVSILAVSPENGGFNIFKAINLRDLLGGVLRRVLSYAPCKNERNIESLLLHWAAKKIVTTHSLSMVFLSNKICHLTTDRRLENDPAIPGDFDPIVYLLLNPDLIDASVNPFEHYINYGMQEGRLYIFPHHIKI